MTDKTPNSTSNTLIAQTAGLFLLTLLALAIFQSASLVTLTYDFSPSPTTERIIIMAETWHGWMEAWGPAEWTRAIGDWLNEWR